MPSPPLVASFRQNVEHTQGSMGDREARNTNQPQTTSRLGLRNLGGGGEIVEVQGGHIVRSTGRKDRHSKVCTAKGPRDRRVRLSAHTAIQFYDVQDRLGYDRPSKAVDWLIKKAKSAIDELAELPPWHPTTTTIANSNAANARSNEEEQQQQQQILQGHVVDIMGGSSSGGRRGALLMSGGDKGNVYSMQYPQDRVEGGQGNENAGNAAFLPASLDSDSIADTIKSFFPVGGASAEANSGFQNYPPDLLSRTSSNNQIRSNQDLRLSLQSLQDPMLMQSHQQHHSGPTHQAIFSGNNSVGFDGVASSGGWSDHASVDFGRMQRMIAWNAGRDSSASGGNGGFTFNPLSPQPLSQPSLQPLFGQSGQFYSQRGPLQSSNTPTIRGWIDQLIPDHTQHHHQTPSIHHPYVISGIGGSSASGGFSGFRVPTRIQGEEEERDGISNKPSSASSDSRH